MFEQELVFCFASQWLMNNARWQLLFPGRFGFTLVWEVCHYLHPWLKQVNQSGFVEDKKQVVRMLKRS